MKTYPEHPYSKLFPEMDGAELLKLAEDIKENGLRSPITIFEEQILDGRHRLKACGMVDVEPIFREHQHGDPLRFVISANLNRRHLTESQRAAVAAKMADMKVGNPALIPPIGGIGITSENAAKIMSVGMRSVERAKKVKKEDPRKFKEVIDGKKSINKALEEIRRKEEKSEDHFDKTGFPIPDGLLEDWMRAETISKSVLDKISDVKCIVENGINEGDLIFTELHNPDIAQIKSVFTTLKQLRPFAVCPKCNGIRANCDLCKQKGFLSEFRWEQCVPSEMKVERRSMN